MSRGFVCETLAIFHQNQNQFTKITALSGVIVEEIKQLWIMMDVFSKDLCVLCLTWLSLEKKSPVAHLFVAFSVVFTSLCIGRLELIRSICFVKSSSDRWNAFSNQKEITKCYFAWFSPLFLKSKLNWVFLFYQWGFISSNLAHFTVQLMVVWGFMYCTRKSDFSVSVTHILFFPPFGLVGSLLLSISTE